MSPHPTQTLCNQSLLPGFLRLAFASLVGLLAAMVVVFIFRSEVELLAGRFLFRLTAPAAKPVALRAHATSAQHDDSRRRVLYRCGEIWKTSPTQESDCSPVESVVIRDDRGNHFITQNW